MPGLRRLRDRPRICGPPLSARKTCKRFKCAPPVREIPLPVRLPHPAHGRQTRAGTAFRGRAGHCSPAGVAGLRDLIMLTFRGEPGRFDGDEKKRATKHGPREISYCARGPIDHSAHTTKDRSVCHYRKIIYFLIHHTGIDHMYSFIGCRPPRAAIGLFQAPLTCRKPAGPAPCRRRRPR